MVEAATLVPTMKSALRPVEAARLLATRPRETAEFLAADYVVRQTRLTSWRQHPIRQGTLEILSWPLSLSQSIDLQGEVYRDVMLNRLRMGAHQREVWTTGIELSSSEELD